MNRYFLLTVVIHMTFCSFGVSHFVTVFTGNGQNQMNINVITAVIGGIPLKAGDEIAAFDGSKCCGIVVLEQPIVISNAASFGKIAASQADVGYTNGYTAGHGITYKFWDSGNSKEFSGLTAEYLNPVTGLPTATPTYSVGGTAFVKLSVAAPTYQLQVSLFLEGFYNSNTGEMNTALKSASLLPLSQPYGGASRYYGGTEHVAIIPADVVDWVLVELRQAATPVTAVTTIAGWPKAYFLKTNGAIVDLDGISQPIIENPSITGNLYVIIRHRNHLAIMSSGGMTLTGYSYIYNFTDAIAKAYGGFAGYKMLKTGVFGMVSGDANSNGDISVLDFTRWATDYGRNGIYLTSDINGDGQVSVLDFTKWATNFGMDNLSQLKGLNLQGIKVQSPLRYKSQVPGK